jgi:hypothetical protein
MSDMIFINAKGLDRIGRDLGATQKQIEPAMRSAVSRVTRWAGNEASRRISKATKVTGKVIKGRMRVEVMGKDGVLGRVWAGLRNIPLKAMKPRQTKSGVTAGPAKRPGAFISEKLNGHVFKRTGKKRLPIEKETFSILDPGMDAMRSLENEIGERLQREFESQLKWQLSK